MKESMMETEESSSPVAPETPSKHLLITRQYKRRKRLNYYSGTPSTSVELDVNNPGDMPRSPNLEQQVEEKPSKLPLPAEVINAGDIVCMPMPVEVINAEDIVCMESLPPKTPPPKKKRKRFASQEQTCQIDNAGMIVPFEGPPTPAKKKRLPRPKVDLDSETYGAWNLVMEKEGRETGSDNEKMEEERRMFCQRVFFFISCMNNIQGDRRFSQWKGSVMDSVVGVFLTQNVSDVLSSSAFMSLAARFALQSSGGNGETNLEEVSTYIKLKEILSDQVLKLPQEPDNGIEISMTIKSQESNDRGDIARDSKIKDFDFCEKEHILDKIVVLPSEDEVRSSGQVSMDTEENEVKGNKEHLKRKGKVKLEKKHIDWDYERRHACHNGYKKERSSDTRDIVDWEAVRCADVSEISESIRERGQNNVLAERIKDFLNRVIREHESIDLEWLRDIPPEKAMDYLLSIRGLGPKSADCVRLLTLRQHAFPVDTNIGRICVRLGWVPLAPLPESVQLHLLEQYPVQKSIQKYLWPRLCKLDQAELYELHYQMITFGKVFCTKRKPNCNACPMKAECKHFASACASANLALPCSEDRDAGISNFLLPTPFPQLEGNALLQQGHAINNYQPIIEEPPSPQPELEHGHVQTSEVDIEDFYMDRGEIQTIKLNFEDMSKALVAISSEVPSIPVTKLKYVSRLRTEHQVYELPDSHPLLEGMDQREPDDPNPYLLTIWTPGETAQTTQPPDIFCNSRETVKGTILIPCRTAMRGSFPLNGTYFQVNEVFADHQSSHDPIDVSRELIWYLPRRTVYFGTSVTSIFRGLTAQDIQWCFWRGYICLRGFDKRNKAPRPLAKRLHSTGTKRAQRNEED